MYIFAVIFNFFDIMTKKMLSALKSRYSNLGLTDEQFSLVVPMAVLGLADDADDAAIAARASESYISDMLKSMQSQSDKIRTLEKQAEGLKKKPGGPTVEPTTGDGKMDEVLSLLKEQKEANEAMQKRLEALEGAGKEKDFDSLVARVGKELNLSAAMLDLCKQGLSSDMDETAVRDALGAKKKALMDEGVRFEESSMLDHTGTQVEAEREAARKWAEAHKVS